LKKCEKQRNAKDMKNQAMCREFSFMHLRLCMITKKKKIQANGTTWTDS